MTQELWVAVWAGLVGLITLLAAPVTAFTTPGYPKWNAGPRDTPFELPAITGRLQRAFANFMETYVVFVVIAVCLNFSAKSDLISTWGSHIYLVGRVAYVPLYALGVKGIRSLAWAFSLLGLLMCFYTLFFGQAL
ncbi:inner membrane protein [Asticcacaulis biprosthecium C19]|uniref:Inner membrane protein n=1 Tax=Asticcacaulis biprosthecium C19 TaxID=715226 RepID=F4QR63_9CAUL|nr:MAPEG family protein [Asticcacaulis biprosthecium]EGF90700.1 inner membrane protein [Asticcacaulis biprosthecium C19]